MTRNARFCLADLAQSVFWLLEIEREYYHVGRTAGYAVGEFHHGFVQQVIAFLADDICQTEAEFQFWNELEVGQIYVTPHTHLQIAVEGFCPEGLLVVVVQTKGGCKAHGEVGAEVVVARCGKLYGEWHGNVVGTHILRGVTCRHIIVHLYELLPEMHGGREAQLHVFVQAQRTQYAHAEARFVLADIGKPLLSCSRVYMAVVLQFHIHEVHAKEEAPVQTAVVYKRLVHDSFLLCKGTQTSGHENQYGDSSFHIHNNTVRCRFIVQIIIFNDKGQHFYCQHRRISSKIIIFAVQSWLGFVPHLTEDNSIY